MGIIITTNIGHKVIQIYMVKFNNNCMEGTNTRETDTQYTWPDYMNRIKCELYI